MQLGLLQSVFQLAVERLGLYMLLQGLGRIHTAQRAIEPLSLDGGVGGDMQRGLDLGENIFGCNFYSSLDSLLS